MLLRLALDGAAEVVQAAFCALLPAVLNWLADSDLLITSLLPTVLNSAISTIQRYAFLGMVVGR